MVCRRGLGSFFLGLGLFKEVIEVEKGQAESYHSARKKLAGVRLLISPHESPRSKIMALRLRVDGVSTVGYSGGLLSQLAYTESRPRPMHLPEALRQLALLENESDLWSTSLWRSRLAEFSKQQGASGGRTATGELMPVPDWASMQLDLFSDLIRTDTVVLAPGSVWATKRWTPSGFAEVGAAMLERGYAIKLVGTPAERDICQTVAAHIRKLTLVGNIENHAGEMDLMQTARTIAGARFAVTNDSGAMHIAAMVGTPVVGVFGPTVLDFGYRPWALNAKVIQPESVLKCRPCGKHGARKCPIGTHECMTGILAASVLRQLAD